MKHIEGTFPGQKQLNLYYQRWLPETGPKAVLLVVHGLAEHSGRYMNIVNYFVPRGYAVYAFDHEGHGKSGGEKCYYESFSDFMKNLDIFLSLVRKPMPQDLINIKGYLYRRINNNIIDAIRNSERYKTHINNLLEKAPRNNSENNPEKIVMQVDETLYTFESLKKHISNCETQVITLRFRDNLDAREIGQSLGIKSRSASRILSVGLKKLRKALIIQGDDK